MQKTIEKIHRKFDTAGEKALLEAKAILASPEIKNLKKIERFKKIGFTSGKPIKDAEAASQKQQQALETVEAIEYYQMYYPSYKWISEAHIEKICKKYGLLYGKSESYLGDIPEKNLSEIEAFKLREEDYYVEPLSWMSEMINSITIKYSQPFWFERNEQFSIQDEASKTEPVSTKGIIPTIMENGNVVSYPPKEEKKKAPFKICAPKKDFNTKGYEVKDGYKLVYDPIVIQPVKYKGILGGLIVSKWGIEGEDETLVNEKNN